MKGFVWSLVPVAIVLSACVSAPMDSSDEPVGTAQSNIQITPEPSPGPSGPVLIQPFPIFEATTSTWWNPARFTYADIWPSGHGITSTQILFRRAADSSTGSTYVAFVVWNGNFVGRIYRVHASDGADFSSSVAQLTAMRASTGPDNSVSSTGNTTSGTPKPVPHPNVDGDITYSPGYLTNARTTAAALLNVTTPFRTYVDTTAINEIP